MGIAVGDYMNNGQVDLLSLIFQTTTRSFSTTMEMPASPR